MASVSYRGNEGSFFLHIYENTITNCPYIILFYFLKLPGNLYFCVLLNYLIHQHVFLKKTNLLGTLIPNNSKKFLRVFTILG